MKAYRIRFSLIAFLVLSFMACPVHAFIPYKKKPPPSSQELQAQIHPDTELQDIIKLFRQRKKFVPGEYNPSEDDALKSFLSALIAHVRQRDPGRDANAQAEIR